MKSQFNYKTRSGFTKGMFNIYQSRSGGIYLLMGSSHTLLTLEQINDLCINCYELLDFDIDNFNKFYKVKNK